MHSKNELGMYDVEVDGKTYSFEKWGADDSTDTMLDISAIVGKPLGMAIGSFFKKDKDAEEAPAKKKSFFDRDFDGDAIASVMEALTDNVAKNKVICKDLIKKFCSKNVLCDGAKINFNLHYEGRLVHMLKVVKAGVEVQYGNFFDELLDLAPIKRVKGTIRDHAI